MYRIVVWVDDVDDCVIGKEKLMEAVWRAFKEHEITIAYRQLDVHVRPVDDTATANK